MRRLAILALMVVLPVFVLAQDKKDDKTDDKKEAPKDVAVSYTKDIKPIIEANCAKCHTGAKAKGGFDMSSIETMAKGGKKFKDKTVVSGKPDDSAVYKRMKNESMPPKSVKDQRPSKEEIEKIHAWIKAGAKEDAKAEK